MNNVRKCRRLVLLAFAPIALALCSCAAFECRHALWQRRVTRGSDGVLDFARPYELGDGRTGYLLVHGFGDGPHVWERLAPALAADGATVRALRLPGWGEPPDTKRRLSAADWEDHIARETTLLRARCDRVIVLAHSMGGCLSTLLAQSGRLPADALVLYAPMFEVSSARSPLLPTAAWQAIGRTLLPDTLLVESLFPDHSRRGMARPRTRRDPFVPLHVFQLLYDEMAAFRQQEPRIPFPVRLVLPGEDRVVLSSRARAWYDSLQAPAKSLHIDEPSGHVLPLDIDPEHEARLLREWLLTHDPNQEPPH